MPIDIFLSFFGICVLLALAPGPDNIFVLLQSALYGTRVGLVIVLGLCSGLFFHTFLVTVGVAEFISKSETAFLILRVVGACYLLYLAYLTIKSKPMQIEVQEGDDNTQPKMNLWQYYRRGIFMNATNPKVTLFFFAFLPQFLYSKTIPQAQQLISLAAIFMLATLLTFGSIAVFSGYFGRMLKQSVKAQQVLNIITVVVFVGLAVKLFWQ
nr:LysE family translocator [Pelistega europaea]